MAGVTFLQVNQTKSKDKGLFRNDRKRREDTNLDCDYRVCVGSDSEEKAEIVVESLHNSTDFERYSFRKNAHFTGIFGFRIPDSRYRGSKTALFIRLTLGH